jgi:di/tricarboxylate transporter
MTRDVRVIARWEEQMVTATDLGDRKAQATEVRRIERPWSETKASLKTTELMVLALAVIGVFLAGMMDDSVNTETTWTLITALAVGYMLSRGLAKAGSPYHGDDRS